MKISKYKVNVDTVEFNVTGMSFELPTSHHVAVISKDGQIMARYQNRVALRNAQDTHSLQVSTAEMGNKLLIEGSPFAYIYGQNLCTSSDVYKGCFRALVRVCKHFNFKPSLELRSAWRSGKINIDRVDLAVDFKFVSDDFVKKILSQIKRQLIEKPTRVNICNTSVSWSPRNGADFTLTFYAKGLQLRQLKRYKNADFCDAIEREAIGVLRMELRLRRALLKRLGLNLASAWTNETPNQLIEKYFKKLDLINVTSGKLKDDDLSGLNNKLRPAYALHKTGVDLASVYEKRTLQRFQAKFRALGIEVKCPNEIDSTKVVSLPDLLNIQNSIKSSPKWMKQAKLVPVAKAKKRKL